MKEKIKLIFPIAGEGSRFGGEFKPFLSIGDMTFVEFAFDPFKRWSHMIEEVIFICTEEQEKDHNVEKRLNELIEHPQVTLLRIDKKTHGPHQTIARALEQVQNFSPIIICDCDHSIDVDPIFEKIEKGSNADCILPLWEISETEYKNWSKVVIDERKMKPKMICEKQRIRTDYAVYGIIGCVYLKSSKVFSYSKEKIYTSDALNELMFKNKDFDFVKPKNAYFYGDPDMLEKCVDKRRKECTIFCDIDGTLIKHESHSNCDISRNKKLRCMEKINEWKNHGHTIVLTTARSKKYEKDLVELLGQLGIKYDDLVTGLPSGPRFVINDRKPSKKFTTQANAIEVSRDEGLVYACIDKVIDSSDIEIISVLKGNSFAVTYLVSFKGQKFVRKVVRKTKENEIHYNKLVRQKQDLQRLDFIFPDSVPKILDSCDNHYEFYYDMEYLEDYKKLSDFSNEKIKNILGHVLDEMNKYVYSYKREIEGMSWVLNHLNKKIFPKFEKYSHLDPTMKWLIESNNIEINGNKFFGLRKILNMIDYQKIKPRYLRPIHGDMTLENIMLDEKSNHFKLIDMDASDYFDAAELDLGKMCQSILSRYELWSNDNELIKEIDDNERRVSLKEEYFSRDLTEIQYLFDSWGKVLKEDRETIYRKGVFYMCMYFIRFVPFRIAVSREHGIFALIMAIRWLHKLLKEKECQKLMK